MKYLVIFFLLISTLGLSQTLPPKSYWIETDQLGRKINTGVVKERYNEDANANIHGKYISYHQNGNKEKVVEFNHGKLNGQYEEYYDDGSIKIKCVYQNNIIQGPYYAVECNSFSGIGSCYATKTNYFNGKEHGPHEKRKVGNINLYLSGKVSPTDILIEKGQYVNGNREGKWLVEGDEGNYREGVYKLSREEGIWTNTSTRKSAFGPLPYYEKGYKALFKAGEAIQIWDETGKDLANIAREESQKAKQQQELETRIEAEKKEKEGIDKLLSTPNLIYNMNSYVLVEDSQRQLNQFAQNILKYNQTNSKQVKELWILAHTAKGKEDDVVEQKLQEDKLYILSLNRCYMIKKYLIEYGLTNMQFHFLPCASYLQKGKKVEIYLDQTPDVKSGQEICQKLTGKAEYSPDKIVLNQALRNGVLHNVKELKDANVNPEFKYRVPIELWMDEYSQNEPEIDKFKKELIKVAGDVKQVSQYLYPLNFQR